MWSFTPFCTTALIFIGDKPAATAASMPCNTLSTPSPRPFITLKTSWSKLSRLTVIRFNPASLRRWACWGSRYPLVVKVKSSKPGMPASIPISTGNWVLSSGSPPVMRILLTPRSTEMRAKR